MDGATGLVGAEGIATGEVGCVAPCVAECPRSHPWDQNTESEG
jgi:hypothetical protein